MHQAAGETDASFEALDQKGTECQTILQASLDWAATYADPDVYTQYKNHGQQLIMDEDYVMTNGGLWIY